MRNIIHGVVEVTTFGHNRYLSSGLTFPFPVISIAKSRLKQAEAVYVGETVVQATEDMLREVGYVLKGSVSFAPAF